MSQKDTKNRLSAQDAHLDTRMLIGCLNGCPDAFIMTGCPGIAQDAQFYKSGIQDAHLDEFGVVYATLMDEATLISNIKYMLLLESFTNFTILLDKKSLKFDSFAMKCP